MDVEGCALPDDRRYDLELEVWWKDDGPAGTATVGTMATVGAFAGLVRAFAFRPLAGIVDAGRSVGTLESFRLTGAVRVPVRAELVARNAELERTPRRLNDAPYDDGWVVRVRPVDPAAAEGLATAAAIAAPLAERIRARRIQCWPRFPELELAELGSECSAVLVKLNEEMARQPVGAAIVLLTDDATAPIEMVRWSDQTGHRVLAHRRDGALHRFLVERTDAGPRRPRRPA